MDADLDAPANGGNGALVTEGGRYSGWGLAILNGIATFLYRTGDADAELTRLAAPVKLVPGPHRVKVSFTSDGIGLGRGGQVDLAVDGVTVAHTRLEKTIPFKFSPEGAAVGHDTGTPLVDDYCIPATYDGVLRTVTFDLKQVQIP